MNSPVFFYDGISIQNVRATNMDSLIIKEREILGENVYLAAVCDGVGSLKEGGFASSWAVKMLSNWFENLEETHDLGNLLYEYVKTVNIAITSRSKKLDIETACTLSSILIKEDRYYIVHAGDSRIYSGTEGELTQITKDHTNNGRLSSAIGHNMETKIFYDEGECIRGQRFLLCSDGLYKRMDEDILKKAIHTCHKNNIKKTLQDLLDYVLSRGEKDNISAAILLSE